MKKVLLTFIGSFMVPALALAQDFTYTNNVVRQAGSYLVTAVTFLMVLLTVWFLITVFNFIRAKEAEDVKKAKKQMINGLIGLFIAVAVWGIIRIAQNVTGTDYRSGSPNITCPPGYTPVAGVCKPL